MDGLVVILIIIGIVSRLNKKKQQEKARKAQQMADAFAQAFPEAEKEVPKPAKAVKKAPKPEIKIPDPVQKAADSVLKAVEQEIPFTKEEWAKFIADKGISAPKAPAPKKQPLPEGFSPALKSTQGESEAEHRRHIEKIAAEEKQLHQQAENLREMRSMNRQKLRQAVIMSEVLGKPVALRKR